MKATVRRGALREAAPPPATVRVAIYTRKSTDEGLDQEFNSLDAQRQAVQAFIESQRGAGWIALPERYDDGGFSGANTDRPAFQRLVADIEAGRIDLVACYKLDRLSRSLVDFARLIEFFEKNSVSFCSITQNLNSATSVGRLTLNILMSFAEFERQVISERTRDKMGATRRNGLWTGGPVPLGYDLREKKLVPNAAEAERVREVFRLYLDLGGVIATVEELNRCGWRTKTGKPWEKAALRRLLTNPLYVGKVSYQGEVYDGAHAGIIDPDIWTAVQQRLQRPGRRYRALPQNMTSALLRGLLRCGTCGASMVPHYSQRNGRRWGYYVCLKSQKEGATSCPGSRVALAEMEGFVVERIRAVGKDPRLVAETIRMAQKELASRKPEMDAELDRLEKEKHRLARERDNLLGAVATAGKAAPAVLEHLGKAEEALTKNDERAAGLRAELATLEDQVIDPEDLKAALASFDPVWGELFPREQARILQLLIQEMRYDAKASEVEITFRPGGVRTLAQGEKEASA